MKIACLHGFMGDPSDWDFLTSQLSEHEVIRPSIRPAADWRTGLAQLKDEIPDDSVLIGYSMGARLALGLTLDDPSRYLGLLFCSGNPGIEDDQQRVNRYAADCRIADRIASEDRTEFLEHWYSSSVFQTLSPEVRDQEIRRKLAREGDDWSSALRCYSVAEQPNYWPKLSEIAIPCLAVGGLLDKKYAKVVARMGTLPNIDSRIVPACGHIVHHEQPHVFLHLVREFLTTVDQSIGSKIRDEAVDEV